MKRRQFLINSIFAALALLLVKFLPLVPSKLLELETQPKVERWNFEAPTGVYKNHRMSEKLRQVAIQETILFKFSPLA